MADTSSNGTAKMPKYHAPKDKNCPYCGQAFTSSSLGRHLDLYIKPKNPKAPDGLHDVEEIKKMRGNITRRQPRASLGRTASSPVGTPIRSVSKTNDSAKDAESVPKSPALPKDGQYVVDSRLEPSAQSADNPDSLQDTNKRPGLQRQVSRQMFQKAQFDVKHKLADAMDTARAAELALREMLGSWRAARVHINNNTMPFDFDPLSLDFPALTLQCLQPPPTLFSSTQHPTSTSWSVQFPGQREFDALRAYFQEEFRTWKASCSSAMTAATEDLVSPPKDGPYSSAKETARNAEKQAESLERQVNEHLQSAYAVWENLPQQRRNEVWVLELARSVGRKQKETVTLKESQQKLQQEVASLKGQIEQINRFQQPNEFKLVPPSTAPLEPEVINQLVELGMKSHQGGILGVDDNQEDLSEAISRSIERWKSVITSTRAASSGMTAQRPLVQTPAATPVPASQQKAKKQQQPPQPRQQQPQQTQPPTSRPPMSQRQSTNTSTASISEQGPSTTGPPSVGSSEQDAEDDADADGDADGDGDVDADDDADADGDVDVDAEMNDGDSFAMLGTPSARPPPPPQPMQQQATLEVPRTRGPAQQRGNDGAQPQQPQFMLQQPPNGAAPNPIANGTHINMSRSMPNIQAAMHNMHADISMAMPGVRGEPMYMD